MKKDEIDPDELAQLVAKQVRKQRNEDKFAASEEYLEQLRDCYRRFLDVTRFEPGSLVRWKQDLANKSYPVKDSVGIVVEQLTEPVYQTDRDTGSQYYREPLDLCLAVIIGDERQFALYWYDSRRFELAPEL